MKLDLQILFSVFLSISSLHASTINDSKVVDKPHFLGSTYYLIHFIFSYYL